MLWPIKRELNYKFRKPFIHGIAAGKQKQPVAVSLELETVAIASKKVPETSDLLRPEI